MGPIQPLTEWLLVEVSRSVNRPVLEAIHSCASSTEIKKAWRFTSTSYKSSWPGDKNIGSNLHLPWKHRRYLQRNPEKDVRCVVMLFILQRCCGTKIYSNELQDGWWSGRDLEGGYLGLIELLCSILLQALRKITSNLSYYSRFTSQDSKPWHPKWKSRHLTLLLPVMWNTIWKSINNNISKTQ
jgi:hypothetical protein